jgi:DNA-binding response OmpR family regulator
LVLTEQPLANLVALTLNHGVYETKRVRTLREARVELRSWRPHLLVVDIELERRSALDLIGQRGGRRRLPTIALSARGDIKTKLEAFERGADDIVVVPFVPEELVARVLAVMRRTYGDAIPFIPVIKVAGLEIDLLNQQVRAGGLRPHLTAMEQTLLYFLASNPGQILGREEILDALWGTDHVVESNVVDRHVRNLRLKLNDHWRHPRYIGTVPGKGYRFVGAA